MQIDVESFVSNAHRTATQFDRFPILAVDQLVVLKSLRRLALRVVGLTAILESDDSPDLTPPARAWRSMQTGQNSTAPENSLPQLGQMR